MYRESEGDAAMIEFREPGEYAAGNPTSENPDASAFKLSDEKPPTEGRESLFPDADLATYDIKSDRDPLDWYIEVCVVCGCQLGPGIGSRTGTGRCVYESHRSRGGMVVRVSAKPDDVQDLPAQRHLPRLRSLGRA